MSSHRARLLLCATLVLPVGRTAPQGGPSLLITPTELSRVIKDPALVVIYVGPKDDYDAGHIAGARFVQMQDLALPDAPGTPDLTLPEEAEQRPAGSSTRAGERTRPGPRTRRTTARLTR